MAELSATARKELCEALDLDRGASDAEIVEAVRKSCEVAKEIRDLIFEQQFSAAVLARTVTEDERPVWRLLHRRNPEAAIESLGRSWGRAL